MSSTKFFRFPFGTAGDRESIPDDAQSSGAVSYNEGWGPDYSRNPATDPLAKRIPRDQTNQLEYDITSNIQAWQLAGFPEWVEEDQNDGTPVSYPVAAIVRWNGGSGTDWTNYISLVNANTAEPGSDQTKWIEFSPGVTPFDYIVAGGGTVLTRAEIGRTVQLNVAGAPRTISLPVASTCPDGGVITFYHNGAFTDTLVIQGTDRINFADGTELTSLAVNVGDTLQLQCVATGLWLVVGGTVANRAASDFANSLVASGYQKLPNGLIIQWGTGTGSAGGTATIAYPTTFPSACLSVVATVFGVTTSTNFINTSAINNSNFGATCVFGGSFAALNFNWIAIGY